jgi:3'-5' exoribonuclease
MKQMISDLVPNQDVTSFFLIADLPQVRKSKKGSDYACLELVDASGKVDARLWDVPAGLGVNSLKKVIVKVKGTTSEWDGKLQVSISQIRKVEEADGVDLGDFFEASPFDPKEMWSELMQIVGGVANGYVRQLLFDVLRENEVNFKRAPAAKSIHHCYISGLLEHSLSLCKTALLICERYSLDKDLMVAACCLHDLSKIDELDYSMGNSYTLQGSMLGHLAMGMMRVSEAINKIEGFPPLLKIAILHMIAAHHGSLAWGSVRVPLMKEALAFHLCDMLDSRLAICDRALRGNVNEHGLTDFVRELEGPLWRGPWQEEESK